MNNTKDNLNWIEIEERLREKLKRIDQFDENDIFNLVYSEIKRYNLFNLSESDFNNVKNALMDLMKKIVVGDDPTNSGGEMDRMKKIVVCDDPTNNGGEMDRMKKIVVGDDPTNSGGEMDRMKKIVVGDDPTNSGGEIEISLLSKNELEILQNQVKEQFHKAFLDLLASDLKEEPPKTDYILFLLEEIKTRIINLTPNNKRLREETEQSIDLKYLEQLFRHRVFNMEALLGVVNFIILDRIAKLCCPADDQEINDWYKQLMEKLEENPPYHEIVPEIFKEIYHWISIIEGGVATPPNGSREFHPKPHNPMAT